jgi:hypothetical protein
MVCVAFTGPEMGGARVHHAGPAKPVLRRSDRHVAFVIQLLSNAANQGSPFISFILKTNHFDFIV